MRASALVVSFAMLIGINGFLWRSANRRPTDRTRADAAAPALEPVAAVAPGGDP